MSQPNVKEQARETLNHYGLKDYRISIMSTIVRQSRRYCQMQENRCNVTMSEKQEKRFDQKEIDLETRIIKNARKLGATGIDFDGDPRGYTVTLRFGQIRVAVEGS